MDLSNYFIYTCIFSLQFKEIDPNSNQFDYKHVENQIEVIANESKKTRVLTKKM